MIYINDSYKNIYKNFALPLFDRARSITKSAIRIAGPHVIAQVFCRVMDRAMDANFISFRTTRNLQAATMIMQTGYDGYRVLKFSIKHRREICRVSDQIRRIATPYLIGIGVSSIIYARNLNREIKYALIFATISIQMIWDANRLNKFCTNIYHATPENNKTQRIACRFGQLASAIMRAVGALLVVNSALCLNRWIHSIIRGTIERDQIMLESLMLTPAERERKMLEKTVDNAIVWHLPGSQEGASGSCNPETVISNFTQLQKISPQGVHFLQQHLDANSVNGGTCSAMSLSLASEVSKAKCIEQQSTQCIQEIILKYSRSGEQFRNLQASFNAIAVDVQANESIDSSELVRKKMSALASFFDFHVVSACDIAEQGKLSDGIYLGRAIKLANNHKGELYGHTIVFFKVANQGVLYDPNNGGTCYTQNGMTIGLKKAIISMMSPCDLPEPVFFQLQHK